MRIDSGHDGLQEYAFVSSSLRTLAALAFLNAGVAFAGEACPVYPSVHSVRGVNFYSDSAGSVVDRQKAKSHAAALAPLRGFVETLGQIVDRSASKRGEMDCAISLLDQWARDHALEDRQPNFSGTRERARFAIGLNAVALKLTSHLRQPDATVIAWLGRVNDAVMSDFSRRGRHDNLYLWSGVNAASFALLSKDSASRDYANTVWRDAIAGIDQNGMVETELQRAGRSLLYHHYYLSGLLLLKSLRTEMGQLPSHSDALAIQRLGDVVADNLCRESSLSSATGAPQEPLPADQLAVDMAFAPDLLDGAQASCIVRPKQAVNAPLGGDMTLLKLAVERLGKGADVDLR